MSLKAFHLIFIVAASALAFGCAIWGFKSYWSPEGRPFDLWFALGSLVCGGALILYERYFVKKLKNIRYL